MKRASWFLTLAAVASWKTAIAQECPVADIGSACDASPGTCIAAMCSQGGPEMPCGACVQLPDNSCPVADAGGPCGDGGVCQVTSGAFGFGGTGPDAGPPFMASYELGVCFPPPGDAGGGATQDAGARGEADASSAADDASTLGNNGMASEAGSSEPPGAAQGTPEAGTHSEGAPAGGPSSGGGCAVAAAPGDGSILGLGVAGALFGAFATRRARRRA
jgi:hypothetical protein